MTLTDSEKLALVVEAYAGFLRQRGYERVADEIERKYSPCRASAFPVITEACEGSCWTHAGFTSAVTVTKKGDSFVGRYLYCDNAIAADRANGYTVEPRTSVRETVERSLVEDAELLENLRTSNPSRGPKVWCDEDTTAAVPGDYMVECMGTWLLDPDGTWRGYHQLTEAEILKCKLLIAEEKRDEYRAAVVKLEDQWMLQVEENGKLKCEAAAHNKPDVCPDCKTELNCPRCMPCISCYEPEDVETPCASPRCGAWLNDDQCVFAMHHSGFCRFGVNPERERTQEMSDSNDGTETIYSRTGIDWCPQCVPHDGEHHPDCPRLRTGALQVVIKGVEHHFWRNEAEAALAALETALGRCGEAAPTCPCCSVSK